jgi:hypothetical protein
MVGIMKKYIFAGLLSLVSLVSVDVYANCTGVIDNQSNQPWTFRFSAYKGNVYFSGVACAVNGPCVIPPHAKADLEYTHTGGEVNGRTYITDTKNNGENFHYTTDIFHKCPHIIHYGNTGSVTMNEPGNGSYIIERDSWK